MLPAKELICFDLRLALAAVVPSAREEHRLAKLAA